ncbi:MAG TPA: hypothetical protein VLB49_17745 [Gemmatimonadales bacterium]|nr:hypothetical protein [Gemmatimonadales bacterium]
MRTLPLLAIAFALLWTRGEAQDEAALRRAFEGQSVVLKIDMPGTSSGVNIYPERDMPVDFPEVATRLKKFGTAIRTGDAVMVTKIRVKDDLIEFQLGGGGYGTFGDAMGESGGGVTEVGETPAEKALRDSIRHESNSGTKRRMQRDLDALRSTRERENSQARAAAAQAEEIRQSNLRGRRMEGGSRFNVRFRGGVPAEALTPDGLRALLSRYVDFGGTTAVPAQAAAPAGASGLRKGLMLEDVERLLGPAVSASESEECALHVMTRTYRKDGQRTTARFVSGVLVEYTITPE